MVGGSALDRIKNATTLNIRGDDNDNLRIKCVLPEDWDHIF